jgi:hypothetical protein
VTRRTVERDLEELSAVFPIVVDSRDKPFGLSWLRDASSFDLPGLTVPEALTLTLVEQHLRHHLSPITVDALRPHFRSAARTLSAVEDSAPSRAWLDKERGMPSQQPLLPPRMGEECKRNVYLALMRDRQLKLLLPQAGRRPVNHLRVGAPARCGPTRRPGLSGLHVRPLRRRTHHRSAPCTAGGGVVRAGAPHCRVRH